MSSTTIIIKEFNDMGLQKKKFAGIVFGMLIVEDIAAIVMMVLLSTVAISQHFEGTELFNSVLKPLYYSYLVCCGYLCDSYLRFPSRYYYCSGTLSLLSSCRTFRIYGAASCRRLPRCWLCLLIEECEVPQLSPSAEKTLRELDFRERTGVNIVAIIRGYSLAGR